MAPAGASTWTTRSRIAVANPASSSMVSPRIRSPISIAASWAAVASPSMTAPIARRGVLHRERAALDDRHQRRADLVAHRPPAPAASAIPAVANEPETASSATGLPFPGLAQEVGQQMRPLRGQDALGVELDALERQRRVADAHDDAVDLAHRGDPEDSAGSVAGSTASEW